MKRVHIVSLGCAKNRVDSEVMAGILQGEGYRLVSDPDQADVAVVNTCTFIQPANEESIEAILELANLKEEGRLEKLVVTGCMAQRFAAELPTELPEVDAFLGTGTYHRIGDVLGGRELSRVLVDAPRWLPTAQTPRLNTSPPGSAWLKISEGCDHKCAFCIIPSIRGGHRSRTLASLVEEARILAAQGVLELNLVGQDTTSYGRDLSADIDLAVLTEALAEVDGLEWIRVHYLYPRGVPQRLLEVMASHPKVLPYVDMPLQHASDRMLRAMGRGTSRARQEAILDNIRATVPDVTLRSTFIVGFPGETEEDFDELLDFVRQQGFHRVGAFPYWQEEGTRAAELPHQVPEEVRMQRLDELMELQAGIAKDHLERWIGREVRVLVQGLSDETELLLQGRTAHQAPEVDGVVYINDAPEGVAPGTMRRVLIEDALDYDLVGRVVD
ncbi:MAG: 30S ribosomal protein S12 methylthiotransferase RimO [Deltaproteobacteria bacterium]|nr:30S ribosomal protein S12 methylthiotransferase RimO [Deltaproteobacteria bacterium]